MPDLLDTNVVSELPKASRNPNVLAYVASQPLDQLFVSAITIVEIRDGILIAPQEHRNRELQIWLKTDIKRVFLGRVLAITENVVLRWRILLEGGRKTGRTYSQPDLFLAATALEHNLTLVTRNTKDFNSIPGLKLLNPWEPQP